MPAVQTRTFEDVPAVRSKVPLLVGLVGPSGTGKTFSALRLATGIQRVTGGDIVVVDTEKRRALHYADRFTFRHVDFQPPYGSLDYLAVLEHCTKRNAGVVVVDSMSHEHDGPGGYHDFHDQEVLRLVKHGGFTSEAAAQVPAWGKPAAARVKLIQGMLRLGINAVFCFRAKERVDMSIRGKVGNLGWMPIAGDAFVFEMTMKCLLLPGADGVPTWQPENAGEKMMCKLPIQFRELFKQRVQLSEDVGQKLAEWAAGAPMPAKPSDDSHTTRPIVKSDAALLAAAYAEAATLDDWNSLEKRRADLWKTLKPGEQKALKRDADAAKERIEFEEEQSRLKAAEGPQDASPDDGDEEPPEELFDNEGADAAEH